MYMVHVWNMCVQVPQVQYYHGTVPGSTFCGVFPASEVVAVQVFKSGLSQQTRHQQTRQYPVENYRTVQYIKHRTLDYRVPGPHHK